ncbi:hypothetical protein L3Q82_010869 [Scortum barcoo]|uniref:Uncharacterized protein n=1 Tax=Scortum barcoo TaxID=214431 RepID=A0ACB8W7N1_9TELE|nr:hypothetical protein L3Q82_010869 [Scortum barcoo]
MFSASIVDWRQVFEVVDARSLVPVVGGNPRTRWWTPEVRDAVRAEEGVLSDHVGLWDSWTQLTGTGRPSKPAARTVLEAKTSGLGGVRWGAVDLDWGHCRTVEEAYFEDLLNPTDLPSNEEAEAGVSEVDSRPSPKPRAGGSPVWEPQDFISAFCADDVVLMASSGQDLQHVLERFAAECESGWDENQHLQIRDSHGSRPEKGGMPSPGVVERVRSYVVKKELSRRAKAKLSIYRSVNSTFPPLTYGHKLWVMTERTRSHGYKRPK